jgi:hypothetical protein
MTRFKWTVEFEVSDNWVADGFDLTDDRALAMLMSDLGWATPDELGARVIKRPRDEDIAREQGYSTVAQWRASRDGTAA